MYILTEMGRKVKKKGLAGSADPWLPFQGPIPPIGGKCPEGTKGGEGCWLGAAETERLSQICIEKIQTANSVCGLERKK